MDKLIKDILVNKDSIESIYLIGSQANKDNRHDSDIDLVIITKKWIPIGWFKKIKQKYPVLDVTVLDKRNINEGINKSPSIYINAINQIKLNKQLIFGNDLVNNLSIPKKHLINNQLYFTLYSYYKILHLNNVFCQSSSKILIAESDFLELRFAKKFKFKNSFYFSYKELNTLLLTVCSYRLIINNKFEFIRAGKNWFISEYLTKAKEDKYYSFIFEYYEFIEEMNSFVFDQESTYLEGAEFKTNIYNILLTYIEYIQ